MTIASEITALQNNLAAAKTAIETKGGTVGDTGLAGLATEIDTIPSGGGGGTDVRFIDYDGTIIAQMSMDDAHQLTELPTPPAHEDLRFVGWTASLSRITTTTNPIDVGAMYENSHNPDQTMFRLWLDTDQTITIVYSQNKANGVVVDWGDGSETYTSSTTGNQTASHTYSVAAANSPYKLTLTPDASTTLGLGNGTQATTFWGYGSGWSYVKFDAIFGKCKINQYAFQKCSYIRDVVFSRDSVSLSVNGLGGYSFQQSGVKAVVLPDTFYGYNGSNHFKSCSSLQTFVFPQDDANLTQVPTSFFETCGKLRSIVLPDTITTIQDSAFKSCGALNSIVIPDSVKAFSQNSMYGIGVTDLNLPNSANSYMSTNTFNSCTCMKNIVWPSNFASNGGGTSTFNYCYGIQKVVFGDRAVMPNKTELFFQDATVSPHYHYGPSILDFTSFTQVPSITANTFGTMPAYTKILVPASLATAWKADANWSTYANNIIGV